MINNMAYPFFHDLGKWTYLGLPQIAKRVALHTLLIYFKGKSSLFNAMLFVYLSYNLAYDKLYFTISDQNRGILQYQ